ncbi:MAG: hypothetical protein JW873_06265 [Candidatus Saganbacteria bacterium]|nr:hypothetical protein [Candidatus Saganbacteria bacterium]
MRKNIILACLLLAVMVGMTCGAQAAASQDIKSVKAGGVTFVWAVDRGELIGMLKSPSGGWVAVDFSQEVGTLEGKLVIGSLAGGRPAVEIRKVSGLAHGPDSAAATLARVMKENNDTVVVFRAKLKDLGLDKKIGKNVKIVLARSDKTDQLDQYHKGVRSAARITL